MDMRSTFETKVLAAFAAAVLVVAALVTTTWKMSNDALEAALQVSRTHETLSNLAHLREATLLIESITRGYIVTGDVGPLAERDKAVSARETALRRIKELTAGDTRQQERWTRVREAVDERIALSRRSVLLRATEGFEAARAYSASAPVRETRERYLQAVGDMDEEERRLLEERSAEQSRGRAITIATGAVAALLLAALLTATYFLIRREMRATEASRGALELANEEVKLRAVELEAANKELEAFSYSVSHDLRAPLRAIDGFARILLEKHAGQLATDARRQLGVICDNARQMGRLIDDLLTFSRLSRQPLKKEPVRPGDLARQALQELRPEQNGRRVEVAIGEVPHCQGDPALLKQVFVNLLSNALKYTRHREAAEIKVGCLTNNGEPVYFVKDNGVGFDMKYSDRLFGVFQRLHRADEYEGTGVGLAIVQRVVQRHGGRVWAEAESGKGATFYFTLPGRMQDEQNDA